MKTIKVDGKPHLCLFALKDISPGEEITYNYGDSHWPWRCKVFTNGDYFSQIFNTGSLLSVHTISQQSQVAPHVVIFE